MPETSKSFHYWQPAPRWRLFPWLANPGNLAMGPHAVGGAGTCHTVETVTVERWRGRCGRRTSWATSCQAKSNCKCQKKCLLYAMLQSRSMWSSDTCPYVLTPLTTKECKRSVFNSINPLTATRTYSVHPV